MSGICFVINHYNDTDDAIKAIAEIQRVYPDADIVSIADGYKSYEYSDLMAAEKIPYLKGGRLNNKNGGEWISRWLSFSLENSSAHTIIKVDPDTCIMERLSFIPNSDIFGCSYSDHRGFGNWTLQGGCQGISRIAAKNMLMSKVLENKKYLSEPRYLSRRMGEKFNTSMYNETCIFNDAARDIQFSFTEHPEIFTCVKFPPNFKSKGYAIIHPRKGSSK